MKADVKFTQEDVSVYFFESISQLTKKHYDEIANYKDIHLDIDIEQYLKIQSVGMLRLYVARVDYNIVGYAFYFIKNHLHYKKSIQAFQDCIFIDPDFRGFGKEFIFWCENQLEKDGAEVVYIPVNRNHDFGNALKKLGYQHIDDVYGKRLV